MELNSRGAKTSVHAAKIRKILDDAAEKSKNQKRKLEKTIERLKREVKQLKEERGASTEEAKQTDDDEEPRKRRRRSKISSNNVMEEE